MKWRESGRKRKYRLGHKGKVLYTPAHIVSIHHKLNLVCVVRVIQVDLLCSVAAEWSHCYMDHLAVLGIDITVK